MNVIAIIGSPKKNGTISRIAKKILEGAEINGNNTEILNLYDFDIKPCRGCWICSKSGRCCIKDDFENIFNKILEADVIILGSPVYWANISGVMKNFFDRHTGFAMKFPPNAEKVQFLSKFQKLITMMKFNREFGPKDIRFRKKKYILVTASTVPFKHLMGEVSPVINNMKKYVKKLKGKVVKKIIYTDTLFRFSKRKEEKMTKKAFMIGKSLM